MNNASSSLQEPLTPTRRFGYGDTRTSSSDETSFKDQRTDYDTSHDDSQDTRSAIKAAGAVETTNEINQASEIEREETVENVFASALDYTYDLAKRKSPEVCRFFNRRLAQICTEAAASRAGKIDRDKYLELVADVERIPDLNELQDRALGKLENMGAITLNSDGQIIAHIDRIRTINSSDIQKTGQIYNSEFYGAKNKNNTLYYVFKDRPVIESSEYEAGVRESKPLFYSPVSAEDAFDTDAICSSEFYLGLWDVRGNTSYEQLYPSVEEVTNFAEVAIACQIYHPEYGNGRRDNQGRLIVRYPESGEYRAISGDFFQGSLGLRQAYVSRPAEYVAESLPNLNINGLLTSEDFQQRPALSPGRPYLGKKRRVTQGGYLMIDRVQYFFGRGKGEEQLKGAEVYKMSESLAVMCRDDKILYTFQLRDINDPALQTHSDGQGGVHYKRATQSTTGLSPYNESNFQRQRSDEPDDDYSARVEAFENFELWYRLNTLSKANGLSAFQQLEFDPKFAKSVLSLRDKLDEKSVGDIVAIYQDIARSAREIGNFMRENLGIGDRDSEIPQRVVKRMLRKAMKLVLNIAESEDPPSPEQINIEMENLQSEVSIFADTFKESKSENGNIGLEDFNNFQVEARHGSQISPEMRDEMERLIIDNRLDRPDIIEDARREFMTALDNPSSTFYVLEYNGNLVGFFRMDRQGELDAYLGSLNVPPKLQGTGIGDETLKKYFSAALNGRIGHASADPRNPITPLYIGRYNFVGEAVENFGESGRQFIKMRLDPQLNDQLRFFNADNETITSSYDGNSYQPGQDCIILRHPEADLDTMMAEANDILYSGRYVMSAFRKIKNSEESNDTYTVYEIKPGQSEAFLKAE